MSPNTLRQAALLQTGAGFGEWGGAGETEFAKGPSGRGLSKPVKRPPAGKWAGEKLKQLRRSSSDI
jgi:hypothetical protein